MPIHLPPPIIDPAYGKKLRQASQHGVEIIVYDVSINLETIRLNDRLPYDLGPRKKSSTTNGTTPTHPYRHDKN